MKKLLPFLFALLAIINHTATAQCNNCTSTLSGTSILPIDLIVDSNEVYCIQTNGSLNRGLHIKGGIVCNNGTINSLKSIQDGGILINNGTINMESGNVSLLKGKLINNGIVKIDYINICESDFINNNIAEIRRIFINISGNNNHVINNGVIDGESIQSITKDLNYKYHFTNSGSIYVTTHLRNSSSMTFENQGYLSIGDQDEVNFQNQTGSSFINTGEMNVEGDFYNHGDFYTDCMIEIGGDFTSHGNVSGPSQNSCGGFNVMGNTQIGSNIAADDSYIDICDAGMPSNGVDQNFQATIGNNVTNCSCNDECTQPEVFEDFVSTNDYTVTPNPISDNSVISFYNPVASYHQLMIFDTYGRVVKTFEGIVGNEIPIDRAGLDRGIYFFKITSSYNVKAAGKLVIN